MKRAFTLIELLVVIAIIAILAAILFPVFAQAKAAAKKTSSLSGIKQMSLAMVQYGSSNNDGFPPNDSWGGRSVDAGFSIGGTVWRPWPLLLQEYIKSPDMYDDPLAPKYTRATNDGFTSFYREVATSWGYNSVWLAPYDGKIVTTKSSSTLANPAGTVLMVSKFAQSESTWTDGQITYFGVGSFTQIGRVDPPDCYSIDQYCFDNWGKGSYYDGRLKNNFEAGAQTGGVAVRTNNGSIVAFTDGHAARLSIGALSAGTNWKKDIAAGSVVVNDVTKYLWDDK